MKGRHLSPSVFRPTGDGATTTVNPLTSREVQVRVPGGPERVEARVEGREGGPSVVWTRPHPNLGGSGRPRTTDQSYDESRSSPEAPRSKDAFNEVGRVVAPALLEKRTVRRTHPHIRCRPRDNKLKVQNFITKVGQCHQVWTLES